MRGSPPQKAAAATEQGKRKRAGGTPALQIEARELWRGAGEAVGGGVEGRRNREAVRSLGEAGAEGGGLGGGEEEGVVQGGVEGGGVSAGLHEAGEGVGGGA